MPSGPVLPYGLLIGQDLLPFFLVVLLPGIEGARPRVDLREAETDCGFEPVLCDILLNPSPARTCDEFCLLYGFAFFFLGYSAAVAVRSGKAAANEARFASSTPRSVINPVTSRAGVTSKP